MDDSATGLNEILSEFKVDSGKYTFRKVTEGLINQSYRVENELGNPLYFLQQIDHKIFKNVKGLMGNIELTISHLAQPEVNIEHLKLIPLKTSNGFLLEKEASYWRLYRFVKGNTYFKAKNKDIASQAGKAYGQFLGAITNINSTRLALTIPRFHDISWRYEQFSEALGQASLERVKSSKEEVNFIKNKIGRMKDFYADLEESAVKRVTHNDTKLSNLLFNDEQKATLVVDYDTLMPGYIQLDYGDSIRTICSTTEEGSKDLESTNYRIDLIEAFTKQFIAQLHGKIGQEEFRFFACSTCYMPFIIGLRMLTDYLNNDVYFRINYPEHNLDRARNQFQVYTSGQSLQEEINNIVNNLI